LTDFEKKKKDEEKIIFIKFALKRGSAPKWTSNKIGNDKKGHSKVVAP